MIEGNQIETMIKHWLNTPPNGYFGQSYGADVRNMLLRELTSDNADMLLKKVRVDIPILNQLDESQLSISVDTVEHDQLYVYLLIGNIAISLGESNPQTADQDFYNVRAQ